MQQPSLSFIKLPSLNRCGRSCLVRSYNTAGMLASYMCMKPHNIIICKPEAEPNRRGGNRASRSQDSVILHALLGRLGAVLGSSLATFFHSTSSGALQHPRPPSSRKRLLRDDQRGTLVTTQVYPPTLVFSNPFASSNAVHLALVISRTLFLRCHCLNL